MFAGFGGIPAVRAGAGAHEKCPLPLGVRYCHRDVGYPLILVNEHEAAGFRRHAG
jgi:hypothetical protein